MVMAFDPLTKGYITMRPAAAARTLARLDSRDSKAIFEVMPRHLAANVLVHMTPSSGGRCVAQLTPKAGGEILARMPVLAAVAILRLLKPEQRKGLLAEMPRHTAARLRLRLRYSETVIGAFVDADVVTFTRDLRVGDALRLYRRTSQPSGQLIYVLDQNRHLAGVVDLSDLLSESDRSVIQRVMRPASVVLNARAALQTVADHPAWLTHDSLPVVNRDYVFQGVLRRSKVTQGEEELLSGVADRNELATTRSALADVFWMGVGALFVEGADATARTKAKE
jgi:magnesium transporter